MMNWHAYFKSIRQLEFYDIVNQAERDISDDRTKIKRHLWISWCMLRECLEDVQFNAVV